MKKRYPLVFIFFITLLLGPESKAQCGLKVVIDPIPSSTLCLGETVDLLAKSNLVAAIPQVCGINPDRTCGTGADSLFTAIGAGNQVNSYGQNPPELFGDFGEAQSKSQLIFLASEMKAKGFKGGKITSLSFDIARIDPGRNATLPSMTIKMGCTSAANFSGSFLIGAEEVFSPRSVTLVSGLNTFLLDKAFDWNGEGNIVIEICIYAPAGTAFSSVNWGTFTRDTIPGFSCWRQATSPLSSGDCNFTGTEKNYNQRPNVRFGICAPKNINLTYSWGPSNAALTSLNTQRTTANPTSNARYSVVVTRVDNPACVDSAHIDITVVDPGNFTPSTNTPVCEGQSLNFSANTSGVSFFWTGPNNFVSFQQNPVIPNVTSAASGTYTLLVDKGVCKTTKTLTVTVIPAPNTGIPRDTVLCRDVQSLNLFELLTNEVAGGAWTDENASGILTGSTIQPFKLLNSTLPATFKYTYKLSNSCGTNSSSVNVSVVPTKSAGVSDDTTLCGTSSSISLITVLDGEPSPGGYWTDVNNTGRMTAQGFFNPTGLSGTYSFTYTVVNTAPCPNSVATVTVTVNKQPEAGNDAVREVCVNTTIKLDTILTGNPEGGGAWTDLDASGGSLNSTSGVLNTTNIKQGTYRFRYKISGTLPCKSDSSLVTLKINDIPKISNHIVTCSADKTYYTVRFEISGGEKLTYQVNQPGSFSGTIPRLFTSSPIAEGTEVTFNVSDGKACGFNSLTVRKRCSCPTEAGDMRTNTVLRSCNSIPATAEYLGGYISDGNDTLCFILHDKAGTELGNVYDTRRQPSFTFVPGMVYGQTYYISAVAGNKKADGFPDPTDDCLSVSKGVPVVFGKVGQPSISFSKNPVCPGEDLQLTGTASGNPTFEWSGPAGFSSTVANPVISAITEAASGTYTLVAEEMGCKAVTTANLNVVAKPLVNLTADPSICKGSEGILTFDVNAHSNVNITFTANPGSSQQILMKPGINKISVTPSTATTYTLVSANYPGSCSYSLAGSAIMGVIEPPVLEHTVLGDTIFCYDDLKLANVRFSFDQDAQLNLYYRFNGISHLLPSILNGALLTVTPDKPGENVLQIDSFTVANGNCTFNPKYKPIVFHNLTKPLLDAEADRTLVCVNDTVSIALDIAASSAVNLIYVINSVPKSLSLNGDTTLRIPVPGPTEITFQALRYQLRQSCGNSFTQKIGIDTKPLPEVTVETSPAACNNTNTGRIIIQSNATDDLYSLDGSTYSSQQTYEQLYAGQHVASVLGSNGCIAMLPVTLTSESNLVVGTAVQSTSCGLSNGEIEYDIESGTGPYTVTLNGIPLEDEHVEGLTAGTYRLKIGDALGCETEAVLLVSPSTPVNFNTEDKGLIDCETPGTGALVVSANGGTGNYGYSINGGDFQQDSVFSGLHPQRYLVTVRDDRGCELTREVMLKPLQQFNISLLVKKPLLCYESTDGVMQVKTSGTDAALLYSTDGIHYSENPVISQVGPGTLNVFVKETSGCFRENMVSAGVTRPSAIRLDLLSNDGPLCWNGNEGFILLSATGGSLESYQFSIDNGATYQNSPQFLQVDPGHYQLIAKNTSNCTSDTISLTISAPAKLELDATYVLDDLSQRATLTLKGSGGTGKLTYSIDGEHFVPEEVFYQLPTGTYIVYVRDENKCEMARTVLISGVGIEEDKLGMIQIYPNPAYTDLNIAPGVQLTHVQLEITDEMGRVVLYRQLDAISEQGYRITLPEDMAGGIYMLRLLSDQQKLSKKFLRK